jgi:hypothetical protein
MSEKKSWGSTVMGWFVVQDQPQQQQADQPDYVPFSEADDDAIKRAAGGAQPQLEVFNAPPPAAPGGKVDYDQVFEAAGIDAEERQRVVRTQELLNSLPPGTDETVKKQIVMASLKAFAVPIEQIVESTAQELQALEAYIRAGAADTAKVAEEADLRIKQYEEEIVKLRSVMQERVQEQQAVVRACNEKKLEIQKVLEFFGQETVARVVRESPKLQEPAG